MRRRLEKLEARLTPPGNDVIGAEVIDRAPNWVVDRLYEASLRLHGYDTPDVMDFEEVWPDLTEAEQEAATHLMELAATMMRHRGRKEASARTNRGAG